MAIGRSPPLGGPSSPQPPSGLAPGIAGGGVDVIRSLPRDVQPRRGLFPPARGRVRTAVPRPCSRAGRRGLETAPRHGMADTPPDGRRDSDEHNGPCDTDCDRLVAYPSRMCPCARRAEVRGRRGPSAGGPTPCPAGCLASGRPAQQWGRSRRHGGWGQLGAGRATASFSRAAGASGGARGMPPGRWRRGGRGARCRRRCRGREPAPGSPEPARRVGEAGRGPTGLHTASAAARPGQAARPARGVECSCACRRGGALPGAGGVKGRSARYGVRRAARVRCASRAEGPKLLQQHVFQCAPRGLRAVGAARRWPCWRGASPRRGPSRPARPPAPAPHTPNSPAPVPAPAPARLSPGQRRGRPGRVWRTPAAALA